MARPGILYVEVKQAADELSAKGVTPTIERLRQRLGAGSFSTISKHLRTWREERQRGAEAPVGPAPPDAVGSAVQQVWQELQRAADARVAEAEERAAAAADQARADAERLVAEAQRRREQAEVALATAESQLATARSALAVEAERARQLDLTLAAEREGRAGAERLAAELRRELEEARQGAAAEAAALRQEHAARAEALRAEHAAQRAELAARHGAALQAAQAALAEERTRAAELAEARAESLEQLGQLRAQLRERSEAWQEERRAAAREAQALQSQGQLLAAEQARLASELEEERRRHAATEAAAGKLLEALRALERRVDQQHEAALEQLRRSVAPIGPLREGQAEVLGLLGAISARLAGPAAP